MLRRLLTLFLALVLALAAVLPLASEAAEPCDRCTAGLQQSDHCDPGPDGMACQPCTGVCLGQLASDAAPTGGAVAAAHLSADAPDRLASVACEPSHAPPRL